MKSANLPKSLGYIALSFVLLLFVNSDLSAQRKKNSAGTAKVSTVDYPEHTYNTMKWRLIGPHRGGRQSTGPL